MIDKKVLQRVKNKTFKHKHFSKTEIDKISNINFALFVFWLDENNIILKNGYFRYSKNDNLTIYQDTAYNHYEGLNYKPLLFLQDFENYDYSQSLYLLSYYFYKIKKSDVSTAFKKHFGVDSTTTTDETIKADLQYIKEQNLLDSTDAEVKANALRRIYGYLTSRNFERFTIQNMISQKWLMVDEKYNLCFITYEDDKKDTITAITKKGTGQTPFKINYTSERNTGFYYSPKNTKVPTTLFVFESVLDLFSFVQMYWNGKIMIDDDFCCISLNGANNQKYIYKVLGQKPTINKVCLCLDNDNAGYKATQILKRQLITNTYDLRYVLKELSLYKGYIKDWNEALKYADDINIDVPKITA